MKTYWVWGRKPCLTGDEPTIILLADYPREKNAMSITPKKVFEAMPDAYNPEKAGPAEMSLQFDLSGDLGGNWVVEIEKGTCRTHQGEIKDPIATICTSDQDFLALFQGRLNAVAAYMSGRVRVDGNVVAIMNLLSFFDLPKN